MRIYKISLINLKHFTEKAKKNPLRKPKKSQRKPIDFTKKFNLPTEPASKLFMFV